MQLDSEIHLPIDGELDLHTFSPRELSSLIPDYLVECKKKGILQVRIIHGKGTGALRRSVHSILSRLDMVETYWTPPPQLGGHGATMVRLRQ